MQNELNKRVALVAAAVTLGLAGFSGAARGQGCLWEALIGQPGVSGGAFPAVNALAVYDDGSGPALYVGGSFTQAGATSANYIAKWNGSSWSALSLGMNDNVFAMTVFDDGSGPALFIGGAFTQAGPITANRIAKWNGTAFSAVGGGANNVVYSLRVFDDGGGGALYAGGLFSRVGAGSGLQVNHIAKWSGTSWTKLGTQGVNGPVNCVTTWNDGGGMDLYAAGLFTESSGTSTNRVSRWSGSAWSALTSGLNNDANVVIGANAVSGIGTHLFAGGGFSTAGGQPASNVARWTGTVWTNMDDGLDFRVLDMALFDEGAGTMLIAGGEFGASGDTPVAHIARWNGTNWSALGQGTNNDVRVLLATNESNAIGRAVYAGGTFTQAGGQTANRVARWTCSVQDCTGDGRFDLDDFDRWDICDNGPGAGLGGPNCGCLDLDDDNDVDLRDAAIFQRVFAGP